MMRHLVAEAMDISFELCPSNNEGGFNAYQ